MTKDLIVSTTPQETKVALLEDGRVSEIFIEREAHRGIVGNIYKGRVTRVLPGMQSAFVDLGLERDAFLYVTDVLEDLDENLLTPEETGHAAGNGGHRNAPIEEMLKEGQDVLVQIVKEPLGQKGARITSHVSLPGRYLVFMPTVEHVGVSRKIVDEEERRRLKTLLKDVRQERGGGGFIARTAGASRSAEDFQRDGRYLGRTWDEVRARAGRERAPVLLHRELGLVQRLLRDLLSDDIASIRLDNEREHQRTMDLVSELQPEMAARVRLHNAPTSILEENGVTAELERALRSKVWLESGGYLVINQTEALVAVDINSGRYTGKKNLEETILKINVEAVGELVRQIRLRDLGGIIVVDFIDMEEKKSRQKVMAVLEQELRRDRSPSKVLSVNEFGLVILTRKRVRQSLERTLCEPCPYCTGSGMVKTVATVCSEIYDEV
jgi:ribonuclease G